MRPAVLIAVLVLALVADALAQRSLTLVPGQRLRVTVGASIAF